MRWRTDANGRGSTRCTEIEYVTTTSLLLLRWSGQFHSLVLNSWMQTNGLVQLQAPRQHSGEAVSENCV
jgi:hypothetical protein